MILNASCLITGFVFCFLPFDQFLLLKHNVKCSITTPGCTSLSESSVFQQESCKESFSWPGNSLFTVLNDMKALPLVAHRTAEKSFYSNYGCKCVIWFCIFMWFLLHSQNILSWWDRACTQHVSCPVLFILRLQNMLSHNCFQS